MSHFQLPRNTKVCLRVVFIAMSRRSAHCGVDATRQTTQPSRSSLRSPLCPAYSSRSLLNADGMTFTVYTAAVAAASGVVLVKTVGLRTRSVSDQKKIGSGLDGLSLAGLMLCCETRSCHARRHNDLEGHSNFSSTIYSILCSEHHYCGDQQWRLLT